MEASLLWGLYGGMVLRDFIQGTRPIILASGTSDISCIDATQESGGVSVMDLL